MTNYGLGTRGLPKPIPGDEAYTGPDSSDAALGFHPTPTDRCTCYDPQTMEYALEPCAKCLADEAAAAAEDWGDE